MKFTLALFDTTRAVIKAERLLKANAISCKIIPVPRDLSFECGLALKFSDDYRKRVEQLFADDMIVVRFFEKIE